MVGAKGQRRLDIDHRITRQHAAVDRLPQALLHRGDKLPRYNPALGGILKDKALASL